MPAIPWLCAQAHSEPKKQEGPEFDPLRGVFLQTELGSFGRCIGICADKSQDLSLGLKH